MSCFPLDSQNNVNYGDVEKEFHGDFTGFPQDQLIQPEDLSSLFSHELPASSPQDSCAALELASEADLSQDLSSPTFTDVTMIDTPLTSEGSSPSTSDSPLLECEECHWRPDNTKGKREFKKLKLAVEKHVKRQHQSGDHECSVCKQPFSRPDNVKPHIFRKHPTEFEKLYGKTKRKDVGPLGEKARGPAVKPAARRRVSMPAASTSQVSPTRGKLVRHSHG